MQVALAALCFFALLTHLAPAAWPVAVFQTGIFALAAVVLWRARPAFSWPIVPLLFAVLWGLFQLLTGRSAYAYDTKMDIVRWATFLAVFAVGASLFRDHSVRRWFRGAMLWFTFAISILAAIQICAWSSETFWSVPFAEYVIGPILSRNHYAALIELVLPIAIYESLQPDRDSLLYSAVAAVLYATLIASASRAGAVLGTCEIALVISLMWAQGRASGGAVRGQFLRLLILFVLFTAIMGWETVWARFWAPDPTEVRREFYISSLQMIKAHPWFGVGLGNWATVYPRWAIIDTGAFANQAHNDWLQWAAEGGIPFVAMLGTLFVWAVRPAVRTLWGLGVIAVFLHALVDYPFSRPTLGAWPFLILGMLAATQKLHDKSERQSPISTNPGWHPLTPQDRTNK